MKSPSPHGYTYFPGCSLETSNRAYDVSTRNVARVLGLEMRELEDWNCCGSTAYMAIDERRGAILSARNLALAERQGRDLVTVCSGCYLALHRTNERLAKSPELRGCVRDALAAGDMEYRGTVRVRHFLDVLIHDLGREAIQRHLVRPLDGLRVACYYGCQLTRPYATFDDAEFPSTMDQLMSWIGATAVDFRLKTKCCGGMLMVIEQDAGLDASGELLREAREARADCVSTACPLCQFNLESQQDEISKRTGTDCRIPVLYFTQVLGTALGLGAEELALGEALTPVKQLFAERVMKSSATGAARGSSQVEAL
jgi:heterodisulfide reductase subunit B2